VLHKSRFVGHHVWFSLFHTAVVFLVMMSNDMPAVLKVTDVCFVRVLAGLGRGLLAFAAHTSLCSAFLLSHIIPLSCPVNGRLLDCFLEHVLGGFRGSGARFNFDFNGLNVGLRRFLIRLFCGLHGLLF
jgi:hypothetical protein